MNNIDKKIGSVFKKHRILLKYTQEEIANICNCSTKQIINFEKGYTSSTIKNVEIYASSINITLITLVTEAENITDSDILSIDNLKLTK